LSFYHFSERIHHKYIFLVNKYTEREFGIKNYTSYSLYFSFMGQLALACV